MEGLQDLGNKIISNFDEDKIERIFLDKDFRDFTLLKIITKFGFARLFADYKVNVLLDKIWDGTATSECDGQL